MSKGSTLEGIRIFNLARAHQLRHRDRPVADSSSGAADDVEAWRKAYG